MLAVYILVLFLFLVYAGLILFLFGQWRRVTPFVFDKMKKPSIRFSIIIPARNEEQHIGALLEALRLQDYDRDLWEVLVVDDDSTDDTANKVKRFEEVRLISAKDDGTLAYKKRALSQGIAQSRFEWILTTDADCLPGPHWLSSLAQFIEKENPRMVVAPVRMIGNGSLLSIFQSLDFMILQGITAAAVHGKTLNMCNGANLAYRRSDFDEVNGFAGIDHIASGDDMLLMQKIQGTYPGSARYILCPEAIVGTRPAPNWKAFFRQRIRWASKARYYKQASLFTVLLLVYLFNLSIPFLLVLSFFHLSALWVGLGLLVLKTMVEFPFVFSIARFYDSQDNLRYFPFFQPMHIAYTLVAGWLGQFGRYEWKGRLVK